MDPRHRLDRAEERVRYLLHEPGDDGYRRFVDPLIVRLRELVSPGALGLDFGAGRFPVLSRWLTEMGYTMSVFDPYFWPGLVGGPFDFIVACEVAEHFYHPAREFAHLRQMLKPGGALLLMTDLVTERTDFRNWYYRRDPTHVAFYSARSMEWAARHFGFSDLRVEGRVVSMIRDDERRSACML